MIGELDHGLVLRGLNGAPVLEHDGQFAPARWLVHEWRSYAVEWTEAAPARTPIELGGLDRSQWSQVGGAAELTFANQLGLARLVVRAGGVEVPLTLEVLSPKFPTGVAHRAFYAPLVGQLAEWAATLPFALEEPTAIRTAESTRPRGDLFAWHFLKREGDALLRALRLVLNEPRRLLSVADRVVRIEESAAFDSESILDIARHPERLAPVPETSVARRWPLAERLRQASSGRRFLPRELTTWRAEETLDTPEHRFIRAFLADLANVAVRLLARPSLPADGRREVRGLSGEIHEALESTFLAEVGPLGAFPWASRVLQRVDGYRDLLQAWRRYQLALDPFESLEQATDARDVATLYEWWCFLALVKRISEATDLRSLGAEIDDLSGLRHGLRAAFADGWSLTFNRTFSSGTGAWRSYSVPLRPDFVLARNDVPVVALDAKFRFDAADWQLAGQTSAASSQAVDDGPSMAMRRWAKQADVYKMHTYRDALGVRCCLVIYPGTHADESVLYCVGGETRRGWSLESLLDEHVPMGVGSVPLSPEDFGRA